MKTANWRKRRCLLCLLTVAAGCGATLPEVVSVQRFLDPHAGGGLQGFLCRGRTGAAWSCLRYEARREIPPEDRVLVDSPAWRPLPADVQARLVDRVRGELDGIQPGNKSGDLHGFLLRLLVRLDGTTRETSSLFGPAVPDAPGPADRVAAALLEAVQASGAEPVLIRQE